MLMFMIAMIQLPIVAHSQTGATCALPANISATSNETYNTYSMTQTEIWFNFIANASSVVVHLDKPDPPYDTSAAHIKGADLYSGNCNSLMLIDGGLSTSHTGDSLPVLRGDNLTIGATYTIKVYTDAQMATCRKCVPVAPIYFSMSVESLEPPGTLQTCSGFCGANLAFQGDFETPAYDPHGLQSPAGSNMTWVSAFASNGNIYTKEYTISNSGPAPFANVSNDHTPGNGNYFYYGDAPSKRCQNCSSPWTAVAWSSTVPVVAGRTYCFTAWFKNIGAGASDPAKFQMEVNSNIIVNYTSVSGNNQWQQMGGTWTSNVTGIISIAIQCQGKRAPIACDFGLDDIEFRGNVLDLPIISSSASQFCAGQQVTLTATGGDIYQWYDGLGNLVGSTATITVTPMITTTYTVFVYSSVSGCSEGSSASITLYPTVPLPAIGIVSETCVGTPINFVNQTNSNGLSPLTYQWDFGDGNTYSGNSPVNAYSSPGTFTVVLSVTDPCGNVTTTSQVVTVIPSSSGYNENCCSQSQVYTHSGKIFVTNPASNPEVWSGQHYYVKGTIVIWPGAELDIVNNSIIEFDPVSKILVLPGGILKVDNSTLTGLQVCGTMWQGVEAQGDKTKNQTQLNTNGALFQSKVILNSATISLAHNGVVLGGLNQQGNGYDTNKGGGILQATNSSFVNCGYGVRFIPYPFVNLSRITGCTFNSTTLPDPGYLAGNSYTYPNTSNQLYGYANSSQRMYAAVMTFGVRWVQMTGSNLNNSEYGLIGINSSLRIGGTLLGQGNFFSNMNQAEVHTNIFNSPFYANRVQSNNYTSTLIPIQSWNGLGDQIYNNSIPSGAFVGIGTVGSQNIYINDNSITGGLIGISASNTGTMGGLIGYINSGNTFNQCFNGTWLPNNNPFLQVHCNNYVNPLASTYVSNWRNFGSLADQGYLPIQTDKDPAGNKFLQTTPLRNQIESPTFIFDYFHHIADVGGNPLTVTPDPNGAITNSNMINTGIQETSTSCIPGPPCTNCGNQIAQMTTQIGSLQSEKYGIESQLDGGQTQVLLNAINSNMNSGQLKNLLLANSPLSDEVLLAYIAKNGTPPGIFKDVLVPNSPVSKVVRPILYAKIATMPLGIKNQIITAQSNSQNRTLSVVDAELQSAIGKRQDLYNQQMAYYIDRTEIDSTANDSIKLQLQAQNTQASLAALASTYLVEENYPAASITINALNPQTSEAQAEKDLLSLLLNIYSGGRDIYQMTATEELFVRNAAALDTECLARSNARVILFAAYGEPLDLNIQMNSQRAANPQMQNSNTDKQQSFLGESYPNPASDQINIECNVSEGFTGILSIFDINGKLVCSRQITSGQQIVSIDVSNWFDGVYMCSLDVDGARIGNQRIVVANQK
jgi:hypothetical protein